MITLELRVYSSARHPSFNALIISHWSGVVTLVMCLCLLTSYSVKRRFNSSLPIHDLLSHPIMTFFKWEIPFWNEIIHIFFFITASESDLGINSWINNETGFSMFHFICCSKPTFVLCEWIHVVVLKVEYCTQVHLYLANFPYIVYSQLTVLKKIQIVPAIETPLWCPTG